MKKRVNIFLLLAAFFIITILYSDTVQASEHKYGDFVYTISNKQVTIKKYSGKAALVTIPSKIKGYKVTTIGGSSFAYNKSVKKVKIPSSVKTIKNSAFTNCTKLESISLPDGLNVIEAWAFSECSSLKSIVLPDNLKSIGNGTFIHCIKLKQVKIPAAVANLPFELFYECNNLEEVQLPENIKTIGNDAFYNCNNLSKINMPQELTLIDSRAFYGCRSISDIELPEKLITIGDSAFYGCSGIKAIELPEGLVSLRTNSFYGCSLIKSVILPASLKDYNNPFMECTSLESIKVASDNALFLSDNGILYSKDKVRLYCCPPAYQQDYTIPDSVNDIMEGAFASQNKLSEVTVPNTVMNIRSLAFYKAISVKKINLPDNTLTTIHGNSFSGSGIEELNIPEGVKYMDGAFYECASLKRVNLPSSLCYIYPEESIGLFYKCTSLEEIKVSKDNEYYFSDSGILFQRDTVVEDGSCQYIYCYPAAKQGSTYTLPKDTYITTCAFDSCKYLRSVVIPEGITSLHMVASNCSNITVTIPRSVIKFPSDGHETDFPVFKDCKNYYAKVYKDSVAYEYCKTNKIPYKLIK